MVHTVAMATKPSNHPPTMNTILAFILLLLTFLLLPAIFLGWLTESRTDRIQRLSAAGMSQRAIAAHLSITRHRVRLALA